MASWPAGERTVERSRTHTQAGQRRGRTIKCRITKGPPLRPHGNHGTRNARANTGPPYAIVAALASLLDGASLLLRAWIQADTGTPEAQSKPNGKTVPRNATARLSAPNSGSLTA